MASLDWDVERSDGVTLVELYVSADGPRRVCVENRLAGPTWPPRREGQPAAGWDGDAFEGVVTADERLVTGYATPAPPEEKAPPARLVADEPADPGATAGPVAGGDEPTGDALDRPVDPTAEGVVRSLGDPVVPRDAVPVPEPEGSPAGSERPRDPDPDSGGGGRNSAPDVEGGGRSRGTGRGDEPMEEPSDAPESPLVVPGPVRGWLRDVERRVSAVERADSGATTTGLSGAVAADRRALARVARRVETLAGRARRVDERGRDRGGEKR